MGHDLFDPALLNARLATEGLVLRPLRSDDFDRGLSALLGQLTDVSGLDRAAFGRRFRGMQEANARAPPTYLVVVAEEKGRLVGAATLLVEQKFIRGAALCGHVEDVVTDKSVRGRGVGKVLIEALMDVAEELGCYKVILDCSEKNVPFYEKFGLQRKEVQMVKYLPIKSKL